MLCQDYINITIIINRRRKQTTSHQNMIHYDTNSTPPPAANVVLHQIIILKSSQCFVSIKSCTVYFLYKKKWDITFSVMLPSIYSMHNKSVNIRTLIELWL